MDKFQISEAITEHTVIINDAYDICEVGGLDEAAYAILAIHNQEIAVLKERVAALEKALRYIENFAQDNGIHPMDRVVHIYATAQIALA